MKKILLTPLLSTYIFSISGTEKKEVTQSSWDKFPAEVQFHIMNQTKAGQLINNLTKYNLYTLREITSAISEVSHLSSFHHILRNQLERKINSLSNKNRLTSEGKKTLEETITDKASLWGFSPSQSKEMNLSQKIFLIALNSHRNALGCRWELKKNGDKTFSFHYTPFFALLLSKNIPFDISNNKTFHASLISYAHYWTQGDILQYFNKPHDKINPRDLNVLQQITTLSQLYNTQK